jgi:hypothetical protein
MARQSEQLEQEADQTRAQLSGTLEELRARMTPGQIVDRVVDYASEGPAADFLSNVGREIRENPMPLVLIGIGIVWLIVASSRSARSIIASTADATAQRAADISAATSAAVSRGQQTAAQVADRASDVASRVAGRTRDLTEAVADKMAATTATPADANAPLVGEPEVASACTPAQDETSRRGLATESIVLGDTEMQPETPWQHARAAEPDREHR